MLLLLVIVALVVIGIVEMVLVEAEKFGWATLVLIVTGVGLHFLHVLSVVDWVKDNGWFTLAYVGGYVLAGIAWSFVKWFSFIMRMRDRYRQYKEEFLQSKKLPTNTVITEEVSQDLQQYIAGKWDHEFGSNSVGERPKARKNKSRIVAWMAYWPLSLIGTVLNDPVRRLFNLIFNWFKGLYQQMVDRVYRDHPELK